MVLPCDWKRWRLLIKAITINFPLSKPVSLGNCMPAWVATVSHKSLPIKWNISFFNEINGISDTIIDVIWSFVFTKSEAYCNHAIRKHFMKHFQQAFTRFQQKISLNIFQCPDDFHIRDDLIIIQKIIHLLTWWLNCIINCTLLFSSLELRLKETLQFWLGAILHPLNVLLSFHVTHQSCFSNIWQSKSAFQMAANSTLKFWIIIFN